MEGVINEDKILLYTQRVYFHSLDEEKPMEKIINVFTNNNGVDSIKFICDYTLALENSFKYLKSFLDEAETRDDFHSFVVLTSCDTWATPFIIKAYQFGLPEETIGKLCNAFENMVLRDKFIKSGNNSYYHLNIGTRFREVFKNFTDENKLIDGILDRVQELKITNDSQWNNLNLEQTMEKLAGIIKNEATSRYILFRYENYLIKNQTPSGKPFRYDSITPNLEHIAPKTPSSASPGKDGYCGIYNEDLENKYLHDIGNHLLLEKSHNEMISNLPFIDKDGEPGKRSSYTHLEQQKEVQEMTKNGECWDKIRIDARRDKLVKFIVDMLKQ